MGSEGEGDREGRQGKEILLLGRGRGGGRWTKNFSAGNLNS